MADIFLSYAREDRDTASSLVAVLADCGWSVFWDHHIPTGKSFDRVIEEQLDAAACVIVVWSRHAVASDWVRAEAREGARREILRPVQIDEATLPLEFRHLQTVNLSGWRRGTPHAEFDRLLADLAAAIGRGSAPPRAPEPLPPEPFYRRRAIQTLIAGSAVALALIAWSLSGWTWRAATDVPTRVVNPSPGAPAENQVAIGTDRPPAQENPAPSKSQEPTPRPPGVNGRAAAVPVSQLPSKPGPEKDPKPSSDKGPVTQTVEVNKPEPAASGQNTAPPPIAIAPIVNESPAPKEQPAPPVKTQPAPPPAPTAVADETSLREAVRAYAQALSSGSRDAIRAIFPSVTDSQLREVESLRETFGRDRYMMNIIISRLKIDGHQADVECRVFHNGIDETGKPLRRDRQEKHRFGWNGSTWVRLG